MTELALLRALLLGSLIVASLGTHRLFFSARSFLARSCLARSVPARSVPARARAHIALNVVGLACAAAGLYSPVPVLAVGWLVFCAGQLAWFAWRDRRALRSLAGLAGAVPLLFSNVSAVWIVGGANDLGILGYGPHFSFYAALHGVVLGWILVGAIAGLAQRDGPDRTLYGAAVMVCFASFLLIAVGIDQLRAIKPVGVIGLSLAIPAAQLVFLRRAWSRHRGAFALGGVSLLGLVFTLTLAWRNELGMAAFPALLEVRGMVSAHGVINAAVVAPSFLLAVILDGDPPDAAA